MMSEVNLTVLAEANKDRIEAKAPTPMQDINGALKECGFGWFQIKLLVAALFGYLSGVFITNTTPYMLPNAECDLDMNLYQKGVLNAAPYIGMLLSSVVAGFLTDTFGRIRFLISGYFGIFFFTLVGSFSQTFIMFVLCKFFEGIVFAAAHSPCMSFTAEYCHNGVRDRVMLLQTSFQSVGTVSIALISWGLLMQNWETSLFGGRIVLHAWNFYLMIISLFPLTACILYCFQPESPKFLVTQNRFDEAREILKKVYRVNTGKSDESFKYANVWKDKIHYIDEAPEFTAKTTFSSQLVAGLHNIKPMFRKPLLFYLILFCATNYMVMSLTNTIRLWYPQLSTVVEHYNGVGGNHELCGMLDAYTADLRSRAANVSQNFNDVCVPTRSGTETYVNSIIIGMVSFTPYIVSGVLVNKVGKKNLLIFCGLCTIAMTLWIRWSSSKTEVVALFATDNAVSQIMMSLLQATTVEVFPTSTRTLAISMMMMSGRIGSLIANVMFPVLLNMGCVVPFFTLAGIMIAATIMTLFLPNKKK